MSQQQTKQEQAIIALYRALRELGSKVYAEGLIERCNAEMHEASVALIDAQNLYHELTADDDSAQSKGDI